MSLCDCRALFAVKAAAGQGKEGTDILLKFVGPHVSDGVEEGAEDEVQNRREHCREHRLAHEAEDVGQKRRNGQAQNGAQDSAHELRNRDGTEVLGHLPSQIQCHV